MLWRIVAVFVAIFVSVSTTPNLLQQLPTRESHIININQSYREKMFTLRTLSSYVQQCVLKALSPSSNVIHLYGAIAPQRQPVW